MDNIAYLAAEIPKYIHTYKRFSYALTYNLLKLKRFAVLTIMAFSFQYLCIYHLQSFYPVYPIYPAMGIAFAVISILGENAILGLLGGAVCAYYLKGFNASSIILYSMADIVCACLGAYLCRPIFASDIPKHITLTLWVRFLLMSALVSGLSGLLRLSALLMQEQTLPALMAIFYIYMDLWLADLNAIIIFYTFLTTWLSIYMSREKVSNKRISWYHIAAFILYITVCILMMKKTALIYVLCAGMVMTMFFAYVHGIVIATLLMYVMSMLYLSYFVGHQIEFLKWLGFRGYTLVPVLLFGFTCSAIVIANASD